MSVAYIVEENISLLNLKGLLLDARFEIERRMTCGSYAEIYIARNLAPRKDEPETVIVKALNLSLQGECDPDLERTLIENIALEAQTMKRFHHANIVRLFAYGKSLSNDGRQFYYLVLEYMPGRSLAHLCRSNPLTFEKALDYTEQIASALSYAHAHDVLHRDVKPNNIMLSADHRLVKLLDFGTARLLNSDNGPITKVGTDIYSAPEHYSQSHIAGVKLTAAVDVYALAKNLYFMLTSTPPYAFKQQQITSLPAPLDSQPWAEAVLRVLKKATCDNPTDRHQSVRDFCEDLRAITEQTVHSSRRWQNSETLHAPKSSRIVIEVTPPQPRYYGATLKAFGQRSTAHAAYLANFFLRSFNPAWTRACSLLQRAGSTITGFCQWTWQLLKAAPFGLFARIATVILICLALLIATPQLLKWWRLPPSTNPSEQAETPVLENLATASTDINIRSGPGSKAQKIGLVERSSKVRVISFSRDQRWCEIEVLQHGREKEDPSSSDRGWVSRTYLMFE
ncbi:MAG TPA: serine/threonine protein kinase [Pyrinomonadaceae bacterium]|nr:serine/threonine protein kinase [Pyrinomonadaceae bacterium]